MKDIIQRIFATIRSRTRAQWQDLVRDRINSVREYVQTNGEKSALLAFGFGIILVVFYKLVLILICLAVLAYQLVLIISDSSRE